MEARHDPAFPDSVDDLGTGMRPAAEIGDEKRIFDLAESRIGSFKLRQHAAETVRNENALCRLAPEKVDETGDDFAIGRPDVLIDDDERVLGKDGAAGIDDLAAKFPARAVPERLLLVGDERIPETLVEL